MYVLIVLAYHCFSETAIFLYSVRHIITSYVLGDVCSYAKMNHIHFLPLPRAKLRLDAWSYSRPL